MLAVVYHVVNENITPVHWEAVLVTAIPATAALIGTLATAFIAGKAARVGKENKEHLVAINKAVNGVEEGAPTLREEVAAISDSVVDSPAKPTTKGTTDVR